MPRRHKPEPFTPTDDQRRAVCAFAENYGTYWRTRLSIAWTTGSDANEELGHCLRQIRNTPGGIDWALRLPADYAELVAAEEHTGRELDRANDL